MILPFRYRLLVLALAGLITLLMSISVSGLRFDYEVESFFPKNDPDFTFYESIRDKFQQTGSYVTVGIKADRSFFQEDLLVRLDFLAKELQRQEAVIEVSTAANLRNSVFSWLGSRERPFLNPGKPERYEADSAYFYAYQDLWVKFFSDDAEATCLYVEIREDLSVDQRQEFVDNLHRSLATQRFEEYYLYGDIIARDANVKALQEEMAMLSGMAFLLILVVLFATFRSFWGIAMPVVIVFLTVLWTLGLMALFGATINMMTVLIPTIISIVALSDVIHILSRFKDYRLSYAVEPALRQALAHIRLVIFLTTVTTSIGFLTLSFSTIQPFIEFGIFTAVGVLIAYLLAVVLLPVLIMLVPIRPGNPTSTWSLSSLMGNRIGPWIYRFFKPILIVSVVVVGISLYGMTKVKVNAKLYEDISSGDEVSQTLRFFEHHFGGIRTVELYLGLGDTTKTFLDAKVLAQVKKVHDFLGETYQLADLTDFSTVLKRAHRGMNGGKPEFFTLPYDRDQAAFIDLMLFNQYEDLQIQSIITPDLRESRITGKTQDLGSYEIARRNEALFQFINDSVDQSILQPRLTGVTHLLDKSNELISRKLLWGLLIAILSVSLMMGFLYKSWRMTFIAVLPNLLPLLMMVGIIGWLDIGMKMSTAIIFTIAFGIAVDDTIHMMSTLQTELQQGRSTKTAIQRTFATTGKAIVVTSVILICGFGILLFSSFQSSFLTGMLISLTLILALFADLLVLPALLVGLKKQRLASSRIPPQ